MSQSRSSEEKQEPIGSERVSDACMNLSYGVARTIDDAYLHYQNKILKNSVYTESQFDALLLTFKQFVNSFCDQMYREIQSLYVPKYKYFLMQLIRNLFDSNLDLAEKKSGLEKTKQSLLARHPSLVSALGKIAPLPFSGQDEVKKIVGAVSEQVDAIVFAQVAKQMAAFDVAILQKIKEVPFVRTRFASKVTTKEDDKMVETMKDVAKTFQKSVSAEFEGEYRFKRDEFKQTVLAVVFSNIPIAELLQMRPLLPVTDGFVQTVMPLMGDKVKILDLLADHTDLMRKTYVLTAQVDALKVGQATVSRAPSATLFRPSSVGVGHTEALASEANLIKAHSKNPQ